jgi:endo-1,4-beta-xylanase
MSICTYLLVGCNSSNTDNTDSDGLLPPLSGGPYSEAPSANDEPIPELASFNTLDDLQLVRDPGERIPVKEIVELTEEDFQAGPLAAVISVPPDVNPDENAAPYFENLTDQIVVAGDILEVLYKPVDPDGDVPGMFPQELAPGAVFEDNFDGTKTYRWQPLQNDVGINEFTVVAIDPQNSQYRSSRTIRIKVTMPEDPSTIPNVAPILDEVLSYTARVNDPVVLEVKGVDYNGTVPTLELASNLPGASFLQHPRYEEVFVLKFIPGSVGELGIDIIARDTIDPSLSTTNTVTLNILPADAFVRSGERLRTLAMNRNIRFGFASLQDFYHRPDGAIYADIAASEFDIVTPENSMKMSHMNPQKGRYQFADTDNLVNFATLHDIDVHGHTLVWHRQLPDWILDEPSSTLEGHMREFIIRVMDRYKDDIKLWDVVNEPVDDNGGLRDSIWFNAMGEQYIDIAFKQARMLDPTATLLLNEFDIAINGPKADSFFELLDNLIERQVPIDGIGFQMHLFTSFDQFDEARANFQKVADRGLDIYITELDISLAEGASYDAQAQAYQRILELCLEQPRCVSTQTWGFTDQYSFRKIFEPLLFDTAYQAKPAYSALQSTLSGL